MDRDERPTLYETPAITFTREIHFYQSREVCSDSTRHTPLVDNRSIQVSKCNEISAHKNIAIILYRKEIILVDIKNDRNRD